MDGEEVSSNNEKKEREEEVDDEEDEEERSGSTDVVDESDHGVPSDDTSSGLAEKEETDKDADGDDEDKQQQQQQQQQQVEEEEEEQLRLMNRFAKQFVHQLNHTLFHLVCIAVYLIPILIHTPRERHIDRRMGRSTAVLDEMYVVSEQNHDINGHSDFATVFTNDYWGRPMSSESSHKSWRPLSVLSFRYLKGGRYFNLLIAHRFVNAVAHAAVAEMVSIIAVELWMATQIYDYPHFVELLRFVAKGFFVLHPTHVEVTANAANRPHLLAVLCSTVLCHPTKTPMWLFLLALVAGYLSSETFLFQIVPAACTLVAIQYLRMYHGSKPEIRRNRGGLLRQVTSTLMRPNIFFRVALLASSAVLYYAFRLQRDWLSIPEGLIRPAENPFFHLKGWDNRVRNYLYVVSIHVMKAWDFDVIGFSHEYGHECIRQITVWDDLRLLLPASLVLVHLSVLAYLLHKQRRQSVLSVELLLFGVYLSYLITLFPISGIVKIGTFIADRIVVASSVGVTLVASGCIASWIRMRPKQQRRTNQRLYLVLLLALIQGRRIYHRTIEWMDSRTLLESSLRTCPRFAKAHLESSKIYSGLYPELFNLTKSRWHLEQAEKYDPDYCDVHQQFAHVAVQENAHLEFEDRVTKSLLCPFTMGAATNLWRQYWTAALNEEKNPPGVLEEARVRYNRYMAILDKAATEEAQKGGKQQSASPLVMGGWQRDGDSKGSGEL